MYTLVSKKCDSHLVSYRQSDSYRSSTLKNIKEETAMDFYYKCKKKKSS